MLRPWKWQGKHIRDRLRNVWTFCTKYHQEYGTNDASVKDNAFIRKHYIPKGGTKIHPAMKKQKKVIPCGGTKFCLKRTESEGNSERDSERDSEGNSEREKWGASLFCYTGLIFCSIKMGIGILMIFDLLNPNLETEMIYLSSFFFGEFIKKLSFLPFFRICKPNISSASN